VKRVGGRGWRERRTGCLRVVKERGSMAVVFYAVLLRVMVGLLGLRRRCEVEVKSELWSWRNDIVSRL
jgi:hypothetical protein